MKKTFNEHTTCFGILNGGVPEMNAVFRKEFWFFLAFIILVPLCVQTAADVDHLSLTGFLRSFDAKSGIVRIDVTSEGCKGLREFKEPGDANGSMDQSLVGKQIHFSIDSSICERGKVYNILAR